MKAKRLLKTPVPGGLLTLTTEELVLGDGILGTINVRRFPLAQLRRYEVQPMPHSTPWQGRLLRFSWADGSSTELANVGMLAAERLGQALRAFCPQLNSGVECTELVNKNQEPRTENRTHTA